MAVGDYTEYSYTGAVQNETLYAGKGYLIELWGAQGGGYGGKGGYASGRFTPVSDTVINIYVGECPTGLTGGWNGGGNGRGNGRGGGGATDIRVGGTALTDRKLVAAGGGGQGYSGYFGGAGGGLIGITSPTTSGGTGGTQSAGGTVNGALGVGGLGGNSSASGGGGGGLWGGGGGQATIAGGGGGSAYIDGIENGVTLSGLQSGAGAAKITEIDPNPISVPTPITFNYTGMPQSIFLSAGTYKFELYGAAGGIQTEYGGARLCYGGYGGYAVGEFTFSVDTFVHLFVGGKGNTNLGGFNGGGNSTNNTPGGGGGGATDIRIGGSEFSNRELIAGGGGGCSLYEFNNDGQLGAGGGLTGIDGSVQSGKYATGGTQSAGGASGGALATGGSIGTAGSGGGGAGYYGGGGGQYTGTSGGGGSSFLGDTLNAITTTGVNDGDGYIIITLLSSPVVLISRRYAQIL